MWLYKSRNRYAITLGVLIASVVCSLASLDAGIVLMILAVLLSLLLPLQFRQATDDDDMELQNLRWVIVLVYALDIFFPLLFFIQPMQESFSLYQRIGLVLKSIFPVVLIVLTLLALRCDSKLNVHGWILFASLLLYSGIIGLSLLLFPKPPGNGVFDSRELSAWYLLEVIIFLSSVVPQQWLQMALLTRNTGIRNIPLLLGIAGKNKKAIQFYLASAGILVVLFWYRYESGYPLFPFDIPYTVVICLTPALLLARPPIAIILTGSRSTELVETVSQSLSPHRVVAFLDEKKLGPTIFFNLIGQNLRMMSSAEWEEQVRHLVDSAPLVIVDTRIPGDSLTYETGLMLDDNRIHKAVFIVGYHGECPALDSNQEKLMGSLKYLVEDHKVTEDKLPKLLSLFLRTGYFFKPPDKNISLQDLLPKLRTILILIAGYLTTIVSVAVIGWLMSNLFPDVQPGLIYDPPEYLLMVAMVAGLAGIASGYLTARLANFAPLTHTITLIFPIAVLFTFAFGPSHLLDSVNYALSRLFLGPLYFRGDFMDVISELRLSPIAIGILIWCPAVFLGGCLRLIQSISDPKLILSNLVGIFGDARGRLIRLNADTSKASSAGRSSINISPNVGLIESTGYDLKAKLLMLAMQSPDVIEDLLTIIGTSVEQMKNPQALVKNIIACRRLEARLAGEEFHLTDRRRQVIIELAKEWKNSRIFQDLQNNAQQYLDYIKHDDKYPLDLKAKADAEFFPFGHNPNWAVPSGFSKEKGVLNWFQLTMVDTRVQTVLKLDGSSSTKIIIYKPVPLDFQYPWQDAIYSDITLFYTTGYQRITKISSKYRPIGPTKVYEVCYEQYSLEQGNLEVARIPISISQNMACMFEFQSPSLEREKHLFDAFIDALD